MQIQYIVEHYNCLSLSFKDSIHNFKWTIVIHRGTSGGAGGWQVRHGARKQTGGQPGQVRVMRSSIPTSAVSV